MAGTGAQVRLMLLPGDRAARPGCRRPSAATALPLSGQGAHRLKGRLALEVEDVIRAFRERGATNLNRDGACQAGSVDTVLFRVPIGITASVHPRLPKAKTVPPEAVTPMGALNRQCVWLGPPRHRGVRPAHARPPARSPGGEHSLRLPRRTSGPFGQSPRPDEVP